MGRFCPLELWTEVKKISIDPGEIDRIVVAESRDHENANPFAAFGKLRVFYRVKASVCVATKPESLFISCANIVLAHANTAFLAACVVGATNRMDLIAIWQDANDLESTFVGVEVPTQTGRWLEERYDWQAFGRWPLRTPP